jgi:hypothetical protein
MSSLLVFNRDYRLEIYSVVACWVGIFERLCDAFAPLTFSLVSSPPPLPSPPGVNHRVHIFLEMKQG